MFLVRNLNITETKTGRLIIDNFSCAFHKGMRVAFVGEEGSGKSSVVKALCDPKALTYANVNYGVITDQALIGYVPQNRDYDGSTYNMFYEDVDHVFFKYDLFHELLSGFGVPESTIDNRLFMELSGGERAKLFLIKELVKNPDILFMDEPTNDLDLKSLGFLEQYCSNLSIPIVFVSHDTEFIENVANTIIHFEQVMRRSQPKTTLYPMGFTDFMETRYSRIEKQNALAVKEKEELEKAKLRYEQVHDRVQHELRTTSRQAPQAAKNLKDKMRSVKSQGKKLQKQEENLTKKVEFEEPIQFILNASKDVNKGKVLLDLHELYLKVGDRILASPLDLEIRGRDTLVVIGENGSGKSTLVKKIIQELDKKNISYGYMPQDYESIMDLTKTPVELLCDVRDKEAVTQARTFLGSLNFSPEEMMRPLKGVSGGQKAKLFFAWMALNPSEILILDEPTRNISPLSMQELIKELKRFEGALLMVTHDRKLLYELPQKIYELTNQGLIDVSLDYKNYND